MAADYLHVTVAGAGNNDGQTWANAFSMADFITDIEGAAEAGDIYYVEEGTYTMGEAISMATQPGTAAKSITIIGVVDGTTNEDAAVVVSDHATGANRPVFAMEANAFTMGAYWKKYGIDFTGSENNGVLLGSYCVLFNCKTAHSGTYGINLLGNYCMAVACEVTGSTTGVCCTYYVSVLYCYIHDVTDGIFNSSSPGISVIGCIIDTCSGEGIDCSDDLGMMVISNTIYNCGKGIYATTATHTAIINNIIDACTVGIEWTTETWCNYIDFNCWNNTDDIQDTDVEIGFYPVSADPGMSDPGAGNFSVQSADPVNDAGLDAGQFTGATV